MTEREKIGKRIAELRKEKGLSQAKLSELIGVKQQNIGRIEAGNISVGVDVLSRIADALGCEITIQQKYR